MCLAVTGVSKVGHMTGMDQLVRHACWAWGRGEQSYVHTLSTGAPAFTASCVSDDVLRGWG